MNIKSVVALGALVMLSGCSTYSILYDSNPQSAKIICNGVQICETPYTDTFELTEELEMRGVIDLSHCEAHWASGAKSPLPAMVKINESGLSYVNVDRPKEKGLENDIYYDSERKKQKAEEKRLRLAEERLRVEEQQLHELRMMRLEEQRRHREAMRRLEKKHHEEKLHHPVQKPPKYH